MPASRILRRALPVCALALAVTTTPALAFQPSVLVDAGPIGGTITATDLATRGKNVVVSMDIYDGSNSAAFAWSTDSGQTWDQVTLGGMNQSQATIS